MAQSQRFLDDFQQKMDRLVNIRRQIQASVEFKTQFINVLKTKLGEINDKIKQVAGLINELKTKADNLERQIGENTTSISDRERQIGEINQQIANTNAEKDRVKQEFSAHKDRTEGQINDQQTRINQMEEQLRQVTNQKEALERQAQALQADLSAQGDQQAAHAQQIKDLTDENQKQLQQQEQQLIQRINECEAKISGFEEQLRNKDAQHQQTRELLDQNQNKAEGQVAELQRQIDILTQENQQLIQRLIAASQAINEANDELEAIVNSVPNADTKQEVDALLNEITQQLQQSIENISRAAQGQSPPLNVSQPGQAYDLDTNYNNLIAIHANNHQTGEYTAFIRRLRNNGPLQNSINQLINYAQRGDQNAIGQLKKILQQNRLVVPAQRAGKYYKRKTIKTNRKQRGGFTYKTGSKRRGITSKSTRRTSINTSRRSSR